MVFSFPTICKRVEELGIAFPVALPVDSRFLAPFDFLPKYYFVKLLLALFLSALCSSDIVRL